MHTHMHTLTLTHTSPPKSAWPGVSTALSVWSFQLKDVYLDWMVMPRSFSRSLLSIIRSLVMAT